jgi:zinc-ribbon domain
VKSIKCSQCGHENDSTRVFCQECGARLERVAGDEPTISAPTKVPAASRFRGRAATTGLAGTIFGFIRGLVSTAILAAILAAFIQMARQPDDVPPAQPANEVQAGQLLHTVQVLSGSNYARTVDISQAQANNYLAASIVPDPATSNSIFRADFSRAFVVIRSGELKFFVEQRLFGWPIYMYLITVPEPAGGKASLRVTGGGFGRMPITPRLMPLLEGIMRPVIASTSEAVTVLDSADEILFAPSTAKLSWKARKPGAP